jgi:hypothetical protein
MVLAAAGSVTATTDSSNRCHSSRAYASAAMRSVGPLSPCRSTSVTRPGASPPSTVVSYTSSTWLMRPHGGEKVCDGLSCHGLEVVPSRHAVSARGGEHREWASVFAEHRPGRVTARTRELPAKPVSHAHIARDDRMPPSAPVRHRQFLSGPSRRLVSPPPHRTDGPRRSSRAPRTSAAPGGSGCGPCRALQDLCHAVGHMISF